MPTRNPVIDLEKKVFIKIPVISKKTSRNIKKETEIKINKFGESVLFNLNFNG